MSKSIEKVYCNDHENMAEVKTLVKSVKKAVDSDQSVSDLMRELVKVEGLERKCLESVLIGAFNSTRRNYGTRHPIFLRLRTALRNIQHDHYGFPLISMKLVKIDEVKGAAVWGYTVVKGKMIKQQKPKSQSGAKPPKSGAKPPSGESDTREKNPLVTVDDVMLGISELVAFTVRESGTAGVKAVTERLTNHIGHCKNQAAAIEQGMKAA